MVHTSVDRKSEPGERIELVESADGIRFLKLKADLPIADAGPYPVSLDEIGAEHFKDDAARLGCAPREIVWAHRSWVLSVKDRFRDLIPVRQRHGIEKICGNCSRRGRGYCEGTAWNGRELVPYHESVDQDSPACVKFLPSQKIQERGVEVL